MTAALVLRATGGAAQEPPRVDAQGLCEMEWAARLPDPRVEDCMLSEQRALRSLRVIYSAVAASLRHRCEAASEQFTRGFGSSAYVKTCIDVSTRP